MGKMVARIEAEDAEALLSDGRRRRTIRSREAVLDSLISCFEEGVLKPSAAEVAQRAGISERTVFRHFADSENLYLAASARQRPLYEASFALARRDGSYAERAEFLADARAKLYEEVAPLRRVALLHAPFEPIVARQLEAAANAARRQIEVLFAPELGGLGSAARSELTAALDAVSSFAFWEELRSTQGTAVAKARRIVAGSLTALLAGRVSELRPATPKGRDEDIRPTKAALRTASTAKPESRRGGKAVGAKLPAPKSKAAAKQSKPARARASSR
jgi:AcrR family transcriptional regulator